MNLYSPKNKPYLIFAGVVLVVVAVSFFGNFAGWRDVFLTAALPIPIAPSGLTLLSKQAQSLIATYYQSKPQDRSTKLNQLKVLAQQRQHNLQELIKTDPQKIFSYQIPGIDNLRYGLPADIQQLFEEAVETDGEIEWLHFDDFNKGASKEEFYLKTKDAKRYQLRFTSEYPGLLTGSRLKIKGIKLGNDIVVAPLKADGYEVLYSKPTGHTVKKVAVILFNFQNNTSQPVSTSSMRALTFTNTNSVKSYYLESSFNQVILSGKTYADGREDIFGWYTIPYNDTNCPTSFRAWADQARLMAGLINLTGYDYFIYAFPPPSAGGCPGGGWASIGGNESWIVAPSPNITRVIDHELGHNFGAAHANSLECINDSGVRVAISQNCRDVEYADPFDVMGRSTTRQMSNFHKGQLNWLTRIPPNTIDVALPGPGSYNKQTYTLTPIEFASAGAQVIRIPQNLDTNGNITSYYYLEYRRPFGIFDNFLPTDPVVNGVSIRQGSPYDISRSSQLIDTTPLTDSFYDSALGVGQLFSDDYRGIKVKTLDAQSAQATIEVVLSCVRNPPELTLEAQQFATTSGQPIIYNLGIHNVDSLGCLGSTTFDLISQLPRGWKQIPNMQSVTLRPFEQTNIPITIISPQDIADGSYSFRETVTSRASSLATNIDGSYVLDTKPPSIPDNIVVNYLSDQNVVFIDWNDSTDNNDNGTPGSGVAGYRIYRQPAIGVPGEFITTQESWFYDWWVNLNEQYCYRITAFDAAGQVSSLSEQKCVVTFPDTVPPSISITKPEDNSIVQGIISLVASTTDNVGVTRVEFYRLGDAKAEPFGVDRTPPYIQDFDTKMLIDGSYQFYAKAYDPSNNIGISPTITLQIDNQPPIISITSPASTTIPKGVEIIISAQASDNVGIRGVVFSVYDNLKNKLIKSCTDMAGPYDCVWSVPDVKYGQYRIQVVATNNNPILRTTTVSKIVTVQ